MLHFLYLVQLPTSFFMVTLLFRQLSLTRLINKLAYLLDTKKIKTENLNRQYFLSTENKKDFDYTYFFHTKNKNYCDLKKRERQNNDFNVA